MQPTAEFGSLIADPSTDYYLFDRVVNVRDNGAVPLGYRGTIIGVHEGKMISKSNNVYESSRVIFNYSLNFKKGFLVLPL